jgi:hypothetical protein
MAATLGPVTAIVGPESSKLPSPHLPSVLELGGGREGELCKLPVFGKMLPRATVQVGSGSRGPGGSGWSEGGCYFCALS